MDGNADETPDFRLSTDGIDEETPDFRLSMDGIDEETPDFRLSIEGSDEEAPDFKLSTEGTDEETPDFRSSSFIVSNSMRPKKAQQNCNGYKGLFMVSDKGARNLFQVRFARQH
jgi:hypothetical protein